MLELYRRTSGRHRSDVAYLTVQRDGGMRMNSLATALAQFTGRHVELYVDRELHTVEIVPVDEKTTFSLRLHQDKYDAAGLSAEAMFTWLGWDPIRLAGRYRVYPRLGGGLRVELTTSRRLDSTPKRAVRTVGTPRKEDRDAQEAVEATTTTA